MSRSSTYGAFNTYYLHSDNTWELAKEVKLNKVEAVADADNNINGLVIGKNTYDFDHFATTETVNQITENIQNTYVTNESLEQKNYVTEQHITENYITVQEAANTYVTNEKVTEVVTQEVETVVTEQIETKVETVIQEKVDNGEIIVQSDSISYDTW
jgi:CHASE3 domain sensor protein